MVPVSRLVWCSSRVRTDRSAALGVDWLRFSGGGIVGVGEDFCDLSLGSNALYINFLRGFSVDMRRVLIGGSEDGFPGAGRESDGTVFVGCPLVSDRFD